MPYIHDEGGKPTVIPLTRHEHHNFILGTYSTQEAFDTDDGSSYYNTHDNFFAYAANGLKSDFGGEYVRVLSNSHLGRAASHWGPETAR